MSMIGPSAILAAMISASTDFDHGISESSATLQIRCRELCRGGSGACSEAIKLERKSLEAELKVLRGGVE